MSFEKRGNATYYYAKHRENGRVVAKYIPAGPVIPLTEMVRRAAAADRATHRAKLRALDQELTALENQQTHFETLIATVTRAALITSGYYNHKGQWRKNVSNHNKGVVLIRQDIGQERHAELNRLITVTDVPDPEPRDVVALREFLAQTPVIWKEIVNIARSARQAFLEYATPQVLVQESLRLSADELRRDLTLPTDTALEKLAVAECVSAHLLHTTVETRYAIAQKNGAMFDESDHWEYRLDASQRRFFRALQALARLRQLALPPMQINIGETRTNIASETKP